MVQRKIEAIKDVLIPTVEDVYFLFTFFLTTIPLLEMLRIIRLIEVNGIQKVLVLLFFVFNTVAFLKVSKYLDVTLNTKVNKSLSEKVNGDNSPIPEQVCFADELPIPSSEGAVSSKLPFIKVDAKKAEVKVSQVEKPTPTVARTKPFWTGIEVAQHIANWPTVLPRKTPKVVYYVSLTLTPFLLFCLYVWHVHRRRLRSVHQQEPE